MQKYQSGQNWVLLHGNSEEGFGTASLGRQDQLIEMYLNHSVFYQQEQQRIHQFTSSDHDHLESATSKPLPHSHATIAPPPPHKKAKKSLFHNFQKHLISTIKKYVTLGKNRFAGHPDGDVALELWQAFKSTNSFNKSLLQVVFGVAVEKPMENPLESLAKEYAEFNKIYAKFGTERILAAQQLIRQLVVEHSRGLGKEVFKCNCNITKFEEFFAYYSHFLGEISQGPMLRRMRKTSKQAVLGLRVPQ